MADTQKMLIDEKDTLNKEKLASKSTLSLSQVSSLLKDYIIIPRQRVKAFDMQAITSLKRNLADARQENIQLRKRIYEMTLEIEKLKREKNT